MADSFSIKDCALIAIATGKRAQNLGELKNHLINIEEDSIYYHFWGTLLQPRFDDPEYHNDFAFWVRHGLHDKVLAERLGLIDPTEYSDLEGLRRELLEVIEERLDELEFPPYSKHDNQFEFIRSQIVIFDTHDEIQKPGELARIMPTLSVGSIFYHFIDARRRNDNGLDDFQNWIKWQGVEYTILLEDIAEVDPYFSSLSELRGKLVQVFKQYSGRGK